MQIPVTSNYFYDSEGNPSGGNTFGRGFAISWQNGPLCVNGEMIEPNGAFVEDIIKAAVHRLEFYQQSKYRCDYNAEAIQFLELALEALNTRTQDRRSRSVEGKYEL